MQLALKIENQTQSRRQNKSIGTKLTDRDLNVIRFILEMKFASIDEVYQKFFSVNLDGTPSESRRYAQERISVLVNTGFLKAARHYDVSKTYFFATGKGYYAAAARYPAEPLPRPIFCADVRTVAHDRMLLELRLVLEKTLNVTEWISDRTLRSGLEISFGLGPNYIPDAIYRLPSGERVAFELEIAQKSRARYRDKIRRYVELIRTRRSDTEMFRRIHVLCLKKAPFEAWKSETRIFGELFQIEYLNTNQASQGAIR